MLFSPGRVHSQGFGSGLKQGFGVLKPSKVMLHRKLPAVIHLTATTISIKATAGTPQQAEPSRLMIELLRTELPKHDKTLTVDDISPNVNILCVVTNVDTPPRQVYQKDFSDVENGRMVTKKVSVTKVSGRLDVDVRVTDRSGKNLDVNNYSAKYAREFGPGAAQPPASNSKFPHWPLTGLTSSQEAPPAPPTQPELIQELVRDAVALITARLVNVDESVEIQLAGGKLSDANKLAVSGLWSRNLETLETMTPLANPQDDAYRLYNIGVANEALGYLAEDHATAEKFLSEAAINYGKATDAKPTEKGFLAAQNRIEIGVTYYKMLEERDKKVTRSEPAPAAPNKQPSQSSVAAGARSAEKQSDTSSALTNAKVIEMFKSGVDEPSIIMSIREAKSARFDLSPDGLIDLAKNGIKGKILDAMRARSRPAPAVRSPKAQENN
jgi:hypothetical protein